MGPFNPTPRLHVCEQQQDLRLKKLDVLPHFAQEGIPFGVPLPLLLGVAPRPAFALAGAAASDDFKIAAVYAHVQYCTGRLRRHGEADSARSKLDVSRLVVNDHSLYSDAIEIVLFSRGPSMGSDYALPAEARRLQGTGRDSAGIRQAIQSRQGWKNGEVQRHLTQQFPQRRLRQHQRQLIVAFCSVDEVVTIAVAGPS
uniref:Uncharacterized protein n=1 Tax=Mycena chlorophos TaxID=658473 RepID=A0ABQ0L1B6_MYCCL|nr:predicted protein [Mycena chlorophos]